MRRAIPLAIVGLAALSGCASSGKTQTESDAELTSAENLSGKVTDCCERGDYVAALRLLPKAMQEWEAFTAKTGSTCEGAAGYLYSDIMWRITHKGDAQWGEMLDDPSIPYDYKIDLISEICEARLGKASVQMGQNGNVVILANLRESE